MIAQTDVRQEEGEEGGVEHRRLRDYEKTPAGVGWRQD